jgi:serine/threonine-protein kinase
MGTVYRAMDRVLGRAVAVKTLTGLSADENPSAVARFRREARAAAALSHPAVVSVYDTGADGGTQFIVMELVRGRSLEAILADEGALDPDRAVGIARSVAEALSAAHAAGIVHRDIKPANVMVTHDGAVKVLDFGIARSEGTSKITQTASVLGTAAYMAPEQALGEPADERSDLYSLGCVLYALLVGHPPFTGEGAIAIMNQHANVDPRPARAENPRVSDALNALVMQLLAKAPGQRPQSAAEVRDRLSRLSGRAVAREPTAPTRQLAPLRPIPGDAVARDIVLEERRSGRRRVLVAAVMAAAVAAILVAVLASGGTPARTAATGQRSGDPASAPSRKAKKKAPATKPAAKPTTEATRDAAAKTAPTTTPTTTTPAPSTAAQAPSTVAGALHALTALTLADVRSGTVQVPAARQLATEVATVLKTSATSGPASGQQQLAAVQQHLTSLQAQGEIAPSAVPALNQAIGNLAAAVGREPAATQPSPPVTLHVPPGHGGMPPGQLRLHGGHGHP